MSGDDRQIQALRRRLAKTEATLRALQDGEVDTLVRSILDQAADAIVVCDRDLRIMLASQAAYRLCGTNPILQPFRTAFPLREGRSPRPWRRIERRKQPRLKPEISLAGIFEGRSVSNVPVFLPREEREPYNLLMSASPLVGADNAVLGCIITLADVTERTRVEDALLESESRFHCLEDSNIIGIVSADGDTIVEANDAFLAIVGYTREDLRAGAIRWRDMTPPEHRVALERQVQELLASGTSTPYEKEYIRKDGSRVPIIIGAVLLDANPFRWVGFVVDLTQRKQAEQALRTSEDRFAKAFRASPDGLVIVRLSDGRILEANEAGGRMFGYSRAETLSQAAVELGMVVDPQAAERLMQQLREKRSLRHYEAEIRTKSGEIRQVSLSVELIDVDGEECMLAILHDITDRKRTEESLREAKETLEQRVKERTAQLEQMNQALHNEIVERQRTEAALRTSRSEFESFLQSAPDAIVSVDAEGKIMLVNSQTEKMFGYAREELLGNSVEMLLPDRYRRNHVVHRLGYLHHPTTRPMGIGLDLAGRRNDGTEFPVEISLSPVQPGEGALVMSIIRDITERKRSEEELARQTARLQQQANLIELAHDAILVRDMESRIVSWNHGAQETYGWTKEEAIGQETHKFLKTQFPESLVHVQAKLLSEGQWEGELVHTTKNGERIIVASRQVLQRDEFNQPRVVLEINRNITARKEAEEKLSESEARFRTLVQQVRDYAILGLDFNGNVNSWNIGAERVYGYSSQEIIGQHFSRFYLPEDVANHKPEQALAETASRGTHEEVGQRIRKDGYIIWVDVVITALHDNAGNLRGFGKVTRDITERKKAEEEIRKLNEELEHRVRELASVNQELEAFSYSVSHDLRAPLRGIAGFGQALEEDYTDILDAQGKDYLRRIHAATQRMTQLIDDLLTLSRVTRSEMNRDTWVDLSGLAQSIIAQLRATQPERHVELSIAPALATRGDPRLLRIALENLLGNAWKFTAHVAEPRIEFGRAGNEDGRMIYFVRDNGAGFDMTYADKLFGPFQRLHSATEFPGTGIGLATVQRIVRRHGGRVWAESVVSQGATFFFTLA